MLVVAAGAEPVAVLVPDSVPVVPLVVPPVEELSVDPAEETRSPPDTPVEGARFAVAFEAALAKLVWSLVVPFVLLVLYISMSRV